MTYISNKTLSHNFFYDPYSDGKSGHGSTRYENGVFYSYSTAICSIFMTKDGEKVAVFSANSFTPTTGNHISDLRRACPFEEIGAFFDWYNHGSAKELFLTNKESLENAADSKLTRKANRETFQTAFYALEKFLDFVEFKPFYKDIKKILKKHKNIIEQIDAIEKKRAENEKKRQEQAEKKRQEILKKFEDLSYMDKIKTAYANKSGLDWEIRSELKQALNPYFDLSFIWSDGDKIKTSQSVTVELKDAVILLKAWKAGKLKHGQTIDRYTVLNVSPNSVKVGCHKIPAENLAELCKELNI